MFLAQAPGALAQGEDGQGPRNVSVRDRAKALYGAEGVRAGAFLAYPTLEFHESYYSNVFAASTNEVSDYATQVTLGLGIQSNWSNHRLDLALGASKRFFQELNAQDSTDLTASLSGRLDVTRDANVTGDVTVGQRFESIADQPTGNNLAEPVEMMRQGVGLGYAHAFNRIRLSVSGRHDSIDYKDGSLVGGGSLEQDDRDVGISIATVRADYALSPSTALFASVRQNWREHDLQPVNPAFSRDSNGREFLAGIRLDLTDLLIGEVGVGQFTQEYDAPGVSDTERGTVRAQLEWYPDELVTITLAADRDAGDSGVVGAAGYVSDRISANVDYEFRRNIILGLGVANIEDDYVGVNRSDSRQQYSVSGDYIVSRRWSAFVSFARYTQDSTGDVGVVGRNFDLDQVTVGVRLHR